MTLMCERDPSRSDNVCVKCGTTWSEGTPQPACTGLNGIIFASPEFNGGDIIATDPAIMRPSSRLENELGYTLGLKYGEPFFVLCASDPLAEYLVETWARNAETNGIDPKIVQAARVKAREFHAWRAKKT